MTILPQAHKVLATILQLNGFLQLEKNVEMFSGPKKCRTAALGIATDMKFEAKCHDPPKVPLSGVVH